MRTGVCAYLVLLVAAAGSSALGEDFPHWRGMRRNDTVAEDSGWAAKKWPLGEPAWRRGAGEGATSPIVVGGKVYVLGWYANRDTLQALDLTSGKVLWQQSYDSPRFARYAEGDQGLYAGPTATPSFDADTGYVYTLSSDGELRAWDTTNEGKLVWRKNLYDEYQMPQRPRIRRSGLRDYGYTLSPLVYNDWLVLEVGGNKGTVVAFDKRTGKELWSSEHRGLAGHTGGIVPLEVEGVPCLAVLTLKELLVLRVDDAHRGRTVATFPWETEWANNLLTPTIYQDSLLISAHHTHHAIVRVRLTLKGAQEVWKAPQASHVGSPVVHGDKIYFGGAALYCLDGATGKLLWDGGKFADGASLLLTKDERIIALGSNGTLALIESARRSPDRYTALAVHEGLFSTDAWPHVVLSDGHLLAKDRSGELKCWKIVE